MSHPEHSACGVGFVASLKGEATYRTLELGLLALINLEHRGGTSADQISSDGTGIMSEIPHELLGLKPGDALANLFLPRDPTQRLKSLKIFADTFGNLGLEVYQYREVPLNLAILSEKGLKERPDMLMAFVRRPEQCNTRFGFEKLLYAAKQRTRSHLRQAGISKQFFFTSLSAGTVVYKALTTSRHLAELYGDLKNPAFKTRFSLFHRRFSTNTASAWDTAQPFRVVAHNGEINTISGNRAWAYARERALGLAEDELLTHRGISDSGSLNEMIEALAYRSSIPHPEDLLAILMPKADDRSDFYRFWSRAMEPWDGPALFTYSDGRTVGARLDRSGFRPCRWKQTLTHFVLSSEAGSFETPENEVVSKGSLSGGQSVSIDLRSGRINFIDASRARENLNAHFDPRLSKLERLPAPDNYEDSLSKLPLFGFTEEDAKKVIRPFVQDGKEGIGSMGDSARLAVLSSQTRALTDFFYQRFAQVTNPPLDYLREKIVTDMTVMIGRKPNIFEPKELIPLKIGIEVPGPVLSLGQICFLKALNREIAFEGSYPASVVIDTTFARLGGAQGMRDRLDEIRKTAIKHVKQRTSVLILSDRLASEDRPPIPAILVVSAISQALTENGTRLKASMVVETGEVKDTHSLAVLTGYGASAVCPYLLLETARLHPPELFAGEPAGTADERELKLILGLESGLLKIMSKMGISVFQSYHSAELFSIVGLSEAVHREFFPRQRSLIGGLTFEQIVERRLAAFSSTAPTTEKGPTGLPHNYLYQEHTKSPELGERHSMTLARSKVIHKLLTADRKLNDPALYEAYLKAGTDTEPVSFRHLLRPKAALSPLATGAVVSEAEILKSFGSGAMSFGAISAESQRDIFYAMKEIGGRSNSGEGGENPYYFTEGITAHIKQVASGRFGVTAEYLVSGVEIQIKIAQGAKPGEGGQLMAAKVSPDIARARHSDPNVDLISPPPMHDIYSIEDLKQLIYELRQLKPDAKVSVKLVSGDNIGTIAVGVAKAGADIIQISGHDGGTGAASLSSMKHAGLPWEFGLSEVHRALSEQQLRDCLVLRVDGALFTGRDIVTAAILGADEFDFGKLLLIAEGCIMARVCEKNTCPTGIATHDPKFKRLYRGTKDRIVTMLRYLAQDVQRQLSLVGHRSLADLIGRTELLEIDPAHRHYVETLNLDFRSLLAMPIPSQKRLPNPFFEGASNINEQIVSDVLSKEGDLSYTIHPSHRAVPATLCGRIAIERRAAITAKTDEPAWVQALANRTLTFRGNAGQGFAVFLEPGLSLRLYGEANDSVAKSMSGGKVVITVSPEATYLPSDNCIIGNCALYGATGGTLYINGLAGNRFAVRNSGATAVVEGVGMHACEYMTRGTVVVLGSVGKNVGAGMTGGELFLFNQAEGNLGQRLNAEYVRTTDCSEADYTKLRALLEDYFWETKSLRAESFLANWESQKTSFLKVVPKRKDAAASAPRTISQSDESRDPAPSLLSQALAPDRLGTAANLESPL